MKLFIITILTLSIFLNVNGQTKETVEKSIYNIKSVPSYYLKGFVYDPKVQRQDLVKDSFYLKIKRLDTFALQYLIPFLSDTSLTDIKNECLETNLKIADLAFFLINDIEPVPYALVTGGQYCTWGECGGLPDGFLYFINAQRLRFKKDYTNYFYGDKRREWVKAFYREPTKKKKERG
jgi:hypothetical protein